MLITAAMIPFVDEKLEGIYMASWKLDFTANAD